MENELKDFNKLICYFSKLDEKSASNATTPTSSFSLTLASFDLSARSESDEKQEDLTDFVLCKPTFLQFRKTHKSEDYTATQSTINLVQTPTYPLLNTPIDENSSNAHFLLKKKSDDEDTTALANQKRRSYKKTKQNKQGKTGHSFEVFQLLGKLKVPMNLTTQNEECLKYLIKQRSNLNTQIEVYKSSLIVCDEQTSKNDNQSEISSCLDSNYESDCNSVCQALIVNEATL